MKLWASSVLFILTILGTTTVCQGQNTCYDEFPETTCDSMLPLIMLNNELTGTDSFTLSTTVTTYAAGQPYVITLSPQDGASYYGFIVCARSVSDYITPVGTFANDSETHSICNGQCVTHETYQLRTNSINVTWEAPTPIAGNLVFRATVLEDENTYWQDIETLEILDGSDTAVRGQSLDSMDFSGCDDTKGCFRCPKNCDVDDCDTAATWSYTDGEDFVTFELLRKGLGWVGLGFSQDNIWGNDYMVFCSSKEDLYRVASDYYDSNSGDYSNLDYPSYNVNYGDYKYDDVDDQLKCKFRVEISTTSVTCGSSTLDSSKFKSLDNKFSLFLGKGDTSGRKISRHDRTPHLANRQVNLVDDPPVDLYPIDFAPYKAHAILMVTAFLFLLPTSLIIISFFKAAFDNRDICGHRFIVVVHVIINIILSAFAVIGFIVIFATVHGYSMFAPKDPDHSTAHAPMGITVMILLVINTIMGPFAPGENGSPRTIWLWFHRCVGYTTYILGVCTIYVGLYLPYSQTFNASHEWPQGIVSTQLCMTFVIWIILLIQYYRAKISCKVDTGDGKEIKPTVDTRDGKERKPPVDTGHGKERKQPVDTGDGKERKPPVNTGDGKEGKAPVNTGDGKEGKAPVNTGEGKEGKVPVSTTSLICLVLYVILTVIFWIVEVVALAISGNENGC